MSSDGINRAKIVSFLLTLAMVCVISVPVSATGPDAAFTLISTQTIVTVTREIYFPGEQNSDTLVEVLGDDVVTTLDSRNNYAVENDAYVDVLSHFGCINQVYSSDYVPIRNSAAKAYTGPFAF